MIFNDDYCINLSKTNIPREIQQFLGLGINFTIPITTIKESELFNMVVDTDSLIKSDIIPENAKDQLRSLVTHDYIGYIKRDRTLSIEEKQIYDMYQETTRFLKENPDIRYQQRQRTKNSDNR